MRTSLLALTFSAVTLSPQVSWAKDGDEEKESSLPAMRVLPVGSSLHDVRIPRFDKNYQKTSTFDAERVDILAENHLKGTNVGINLYKEGKIQLGTHLNSVSYYTETETIHSLDNLTLSGDQFDIAAQGLILDWKKQAGFLLGKTQTLFYPEIDQKAQSPETPINSQKSETSVNISQKTKKTAAALATIPALLTAEELKEVDTLAQPSTEAFAQAEAQAEAEIKAMQDTSHQVDKQKAQIRGQLVSVVNDQTTPVSEPEPLPVKKEAIPVTISSDDGMFFDATSGTAVYQKNIIITHPQYHLTCSDEFKAILKQAPKQEKKEEATPTTPENAKEADTANTPDTNQLAKFTGLDKAIATGNVVIKAKDSKGKLIIAKAQIATYDADTGVMILKGGRPTIQQGEQIARILSDSGYIKIDSNMNVVLQGRSEIKANLNELQNN